MSIALVLLLLSGGCSPGAPAELESLQSQTAELERQIDDLGEQRVRLEELLHANRALEREIQALTIEVGVLRKKAKEPKPTVRPPR